MNKANEPYVKKYENGVLVNPITKNKPYLTNSPTSRQVASKPVVNNKKGIRLVITDLGKGLFMKTKITRKIFKEKITGNIERGTKTSQSRQVQLIQEVSFSQLKNK